ncbi:MAG: MFS transporter [Nostocales cyanobacterium 94392]|nr:MFS transporter [Nostocales cyanobacterium 94392]
MIESTHIMPLLSRSMTWIAQIIVEPPTRLTPAETSVAFSGPRFFIALIAGIILAFAIQLVLTNFAVAAGISYLGHSSDSDSNNNSNDQDGSFGSTISKIGTAVGIGTLVSVTLSLFIACFLAVKLSLLALDLGLGAILGLVIWAAYFCLLVWVSSTTVGSLIGNVVNTATSGFQAIMGTAMAALGAKAVNRQVVATAEAAASAVRHEIGNAIDPESIRENLEDYLDTVRPKELDVQSIRKEFESLLRDASVHSVAGAAELRNIDKQKFVELVSSRTDLSKKEVRRIADTLYDVWQQTVGSQQGGGAGNGLSELVDYLKTVTPGQSKTDELEAKLDRVINEMRSQKQENRDAQEQSVSPLQLTMQQALTSLAGIVMGRTDLSDLDVEKIINSITKAKDKATEQADKMGLPTPQFYSTVRADVENYLHNTYAWQLSNDKVEQEFRDVIYDEAADPGTVRRELEKLDRSDFVAILKQRGLLTQAEIKQIADRLEALRKGVLIQVRAEEEKEILQDLQRRVESYLLVTPKSNLTGEHLHQDFKPILADSDADYETLAIRLSRFDRGQMRSILVQRNDINSAEIDPILDELENQRDQALIESKGLADQAKYQAESLWLNLESYLRNTGKSELNPDAIRAELKTLLQDPQAGMSAIQTRLARFDRDTLVQLLNQRQDLTEEQINEYIDTVEQSWNSVRHAPGQIVDKARAQYDNVTTTIADYLRNTGKSELNPEGIQRDFNKLFQNPQEGAIALRRRLSQIDRNTLVKLLSQRQDLSEDEVNQVIDSVQSSIRQTIGAPRRFVTRTQERVQDFQIYLEEYLRETGKQELNPEGIKRDLNLLLNDPRVGMDSLGDRLSKFDRSTIVALLQIRGDMSNEEAEQIADNIMSVREQFVAQIRNIQRRIQDTIDGIFERIRNYLNSLERPELNYDGIKRDVRQLFYDPQAGFDALRGRLSSFNRDTYVALMSSRDDISEEDANKVIDQIENARNTVLRRAERIQEEAQRRLEEVKYQAQKQAEETRKAAASAAWWLFATAVVSAIFSAIGGALAVATNVT